MAGLLSTIIPPIVAPVQYIQVSTVNVDCGVNVAEVALVIASDKPLKFALHPTGLNGVNEPMLGLPTRVTMSLRLVSSINL